MSDPLAERFVAALEADGWPVSVDDQGLVHTAFSGSRTAFPCVGVVVEQERQVVFYAIHPAALPEERRGVVARLCAGATAQLAVASLEIAEDHGHVRCRSSIDLATAALDDTALEVLLTQLARNVVVAADEWFPLVDGLLG